MTNGSEASFDTELRISPKWVIALLPLVGLALYMIGGTVTNQAGLFNYALLVLLTYAAAGAGRLITRWSQLAARWFAVVALLAVVWALHVWIGMPGSLALAAIPTALAIPLISLGAGLATAAGQTLLLLILWPAVSSVVDSPAVGVALLAVWGTMAVMTAAHRSMRQAAQWSWDYFRQAHSLLQEARDRHAELEQALEDLARANLQLTRLNSLAQGLRQAAEDARTAKQQFVANVSHELRTPLNMIIGFSEMILQVPETYGETIPTSLLADLAVIHRNAAHLSGMIDDVLDLSQVDAGQMGLTKAQLEFREIVDSTATAVRPLYESKGLYLKTNVPDDLPLVYCDRTRMSEVMMNLLSNAGRFTERGGVDVYVQRESNSVIVAVADTGRGIASGDLSRIFEPFQQADGTIRRRYGGTGLGLSISKRFIERHGGRIWVESEEGVGTTFRFSIPVAPAPPMSSDFSRWLIPDWEYVGRSQPSAAPKMEDRTRYVILEEGQDLQALVARHLDGVEVVGTKDPAEALRELSLEPARALLINRPSPATTLEHFDAMTPLPPGTPVAICAIARASEAATAIGADVRLVKPVSRESLLDSLDRLGVSEGTVLIVDDEPDALQLFRRMLASSGRAFRVLLARDGQDALAILHEHRPDVILLDLVMPNLDGFQLLQVIGNDLGLSRIPVIVVSATDPAGQPIVSRSLTVTQEGGLSAIQLLRSIEAITGVLSPGAQVAHRVLSEAGYG